MSARQRRRATFAVEPIERRTLLTAELVAQLAQAPTALTPVGADLYYTVEEGASYFTSGVHRLYRRDASGRVARVDSADGQPGNFGRDPYILRAGTKTFLMNRDRSANQLFVLDERTSRAGPLLPGGVIAYDGARPVAYNGQLYFAATQRAQVQIPGGGGEVWRSDGTTAGTVRVADLNGARDSDPHSLTVAGRTLYFVASTGPRGSWQLWKTDGTAARTRLVKKLDGSVTDLTAHGGKLFFTSGSALGLGPLYLTDGSDAGTRAVGGAYDFTKSIGAIVSAGSRLYFTASDARAGREVWVTDANGVTARRVTDLEPGPVDGVKNYENYFVARGEDLYVASGPDLNAALSPPKPRVWRVGRDDRAVLLHDGRATALSAGAGKVYFVASGGTFSGVFSTDGTRTGTHEIGVQARAFAPGDGDHGRPLYFSDYDGAIYRATPATAAAGGVVFNDMNGDGSRQFNEPGLVGHRVFADLNGNGRPDAPEPTARSGKSGRWHIDGLRAGTYTVRLVAATQWSQTTPRAPRLKLAADHTARLDVGVRGALGALAGTIFNDANDNGARDAGETGAAGFRVFLDLNKSSELDRGEPWTRTNSAGRYRFAGLAPGPYTVRVTEAQGWRAKDAEWKRGVNVHPAAERRANFAVRAFMQVRGVVFVDHNNNGRRDQYEGTEYTPIWIDLDYDGRWDDDEDVRGNAQGEYWFRDVPVGTYEVRALTSAGDVARPAGGSYLVSTSRPQVFEGLDFRLRR